MKNLAIAMIGAIALTGGVSTASYASSDTITTQCAKQETNLYRCTISGTTTQSVTEFPWSKTPGADVAYGVFPMASGNGTIEYTPDKIIVRFNEDYAKTHQNLQFSGFTEVRVNAYHHGNDQSITINGTKVNVPGEGYCDEECKNRDVEGVYKSGWDGKDGSVDWGIVLGKSYLEGKTGQTFTITEQPGKGLQACTFQSVQVQVRNDKGINEWKWTPATGLGTDRVSFTVVNPGAHRALVNCTPEPGAKVTENTAVVNGQTLTGGWTRKNAGADGDGTKTPPTPPAPPVVPTPPKVPGGNIPVTPRPALVQDSAYVQVDNYRTNTRARKREVAAYDNDGLLRYREDRGQWGKAKWELRKVDFSYVHIPGDRQGDNERRTAALANAAGVTNTQRVSTINTSRKTIVWELREGSWSVQRPGARAPQYYLGTK